MSTELCAKFKDIDPFLLKKWERIFKAFFDHNAKEQVVWTDFYMITRKVRDIYGAESAQMTYARHSMKALWEGLLAIADRNHDKVITIDEWIVLLKEQHPDNPKKGESPWFKDYMTFMFRLFDVSEDGKMDLAEYSDGMTTYGLEDDAESHEAFKIFSVDKKGKPIPGIDWAQWNVLWHEYFFSVKKDAIGNNLFGKMKA